MKVFVTGATGFIGSAVAAAFARAGHETYGLVRTPGKERLLEAVEVVPVFGTMDEPDDWRPAAERCSVLVHCAVEYSERLLGPPPSRPRRPAGRRARPRRTGPPLDERSLGLR